MAKLFIFLLILLYPAISFAEEDSCPSLKGAAEALDKRALKLMKDYNPETRVFGFSTFMIREKDPEEAGNTILRMTGLIRGCSFLLEGKSCGYVSSEIISILSRGLSICKKDVQNKCGLCN